MLLGYHFTCIVKKSFDFLPDTEPNGEFSFAILLLELLSRKNNTFCTGILLLAIEILNIRSIISYRIMRSKPI